MGGIFGGSPSVPQPPKPKKLTVKPEDDDEVTTATRRKRRTRQESVLTTGLGILSPNAQPVKTLLGGGR